MKPLQFLLESYVFQNSSKNNHIFGILLYENLLPRTFKNRPIWSHCSQPFASKMSCNFCIHFSASSTMIKTYFNFARVQHSLSKTFLITFLSFFFNNFKAFSNRYFAYLAYLLVLITECLFSLSLSLSLSRSHKRTCRSPPRCDHTSCR